MHCFPRVSKNRPFQIHTENLEWRYSEKELQAFYTGNTGFPIVDAGIRQMLAEGWMHNRLRMVVAMFFTKNMLHDWRLVEKFFRPLGSFRSLYFSTSVRPKLRTSIVLKILCFNSAGNLL